MGFGFKEIKQKFFPDDNYVGNDYDFEEEKYIDDEVAVPSQDTFEDRKSITTATRVVGAPRATTALEMKVVSPTKYEAVTQIADILLDKKTVLLNLENTNKETAKRLIDFLSGVAYALGGDIQKVADNTFAVTPNNVEVSNESFDAGFGEAEEE